MPHFLSLGLEDWSESDVLTQVLAASQQEYLDVLKHAKPTDDYKENHQTAADGNSCNSQPITLSPTKLKEQSSLSTNASSSPSKSRHKNTNSPKQHQNLETFINIEQNESNFPTDQSEQSNNNESHNSEVTDVGQQQTNNNNVPSKERSPGSAKSEHGIKRRPAGTKSPSATQDNS